VMGRLEDIQPGAFAPNGINWFGGGFT